MDPSLTFRFLVRLVSKTLIGELLASGFNLKL